MTSYLITGTMGFIGRALTARLAADGHQVFAVGRSLQSSPSANLQPVLADLAQPGWTARLPAPVEQVIHLAQSKRYREFPAGAADMVRINIDATAELLDWAQANQVQRFVFASTGNVYQPSPASLDESAPCQPASMYAATKLSAEYLVQQYQRFYETRILRFFGVYGPTQRDMIVPNMLNRVRNGQEITLAQGIGLAFTPIYIDDCVELMVRLLTQPAATSYEVYNVAGNQEVTLDKVVAAIGAYFKVVPLARRTDDHPGSLVGNAQKLYRAVNYQPQISFSAGLQQVMQSC